MKNEMKQMPADSLKNFHLPRYAQLPDVGLYLEQTTQYINNYLAPLGCIEITGSMISNYVKKGLIVNPIKKQYYADQIAYLFAITILKNALSLEHLNTLFIRQKDIYSSEMAYNYFCMELENILYFQFGLKDSVEEISKRGSVEQKMLRSAIISVSHIIYLNHCFDALEAEKSEDNEEKKSKKN